MATIQVHDREIVWVRIALTVHKLDRFAWVQVAYVTVRVDYLLCQALQGKERNSVTKERDSSAHIFDMIV